MLTLTQTQKLAKKMTIVLYGSSYWKEIINFDALVKYGTISPEDLEPVPVRRRSGDRVRTSEERPDHVRRYSPETPEIAGDFEVAESAKTGRHGVAMFRGEVAPPGWSCGSFATAAMPEEVCRRRWSATAHTSGSGCRGWTRRIRRPTSANCSSTASIGPVRSETGARRPPSGWRTRFAGSIGCHPIDWPNRSCSIGYWLDAGSTRAKA